MSSAISEIPKKNRIIPYRKADLTLRNVGDMI